MNFLKVVKPPWPKWHEAGIWRFGYMLPWAPTLPDWWMWYWMVGFYPLDMDFVPDLWIRRLHGEWP